MPGIRAVIKHILKLVAKKATYSMIFSSNFYLMVSSGIGMPNKISNTVI